jgi:hypothetical protein
MKSGELKVGVHYGVIPSWDYSSSDKKNPDTVSRGSLANAELVSLDKYDYKVFRFDSPHNPNFQPADKGARSVGYMVRSQKWATKPDEWTYWLARPQDIVAEYPSLEARWAVREAEEQAREEKARIEREEAQRKRAELENYQQRILDSSMLALKTIIGDRINSVRGSVGNRRDANGDYTPIATVEFDARVLQTLIEKILEARDSVA